MSSSAQTIDNRPPSIYSTTGSSAQIRILLVDDEPLARAMLREMLSDDPDAIIIDESYNGRHALEAVRRHAPDLVFLDVQMPEAGGFDLLEALGRAPAPHVIFVTAYDQYAVRAFEVHALDYLLKPFDRGRFDGCWQRAKAQILRDREQNTNNQILELLEDLKAGHQYLERLVVKAGGRIYFVRTDEIDWIEAEGNYVSVHTGNKSHLLRETISNLAAQVDPKQFVRIHRSTIVRLDRIKELQPWFHGEYRVILHDATQLTVSRNYRENLQQVLGKLP
jgi:two-component system, LytTR family, response regulator